MLPPYQLAAGPSECKSVVDRVRGGSAAQRLLLLGLCCAAPCPLKCCSCSLSICHVDLPAQAGKECLLELVDANSEGVSDVSSFCDEADSAAEA